MRGRILATARAERPNVQPFRARSWARPLAAVAAAAACAVVGLAAWNVSLHNRLDHAREALRGVPLTGANGSVVVSGSDGALVDSDLAPAPAGRTYEAWVVKDGRASPAGTFAGGGRTIVIRLRRALPAGQGNEKELVLTPGMEGVIVLSTGDLSDPQFLQRLQENMQSLKVVCESVTVAASPQTQSVVDTLPAMTPLPSPHG